MSCKTLFFVKIYKYTQVLPEVRTLLDDAGEPEIQCYIYTQ